MKFLIPIAIFFLIKSDAENLLKSSVDQFRQVFRYSPLIWAIVCTPFFLIFTPIYLLRRRQFELTRTTKATGILIIWLLSVIYFELFVHVFADLSFTPQFLQMELMKMMTVTVFAGLWMFALIYRSHRTSFYEVVSLSLSPLTFKKEILLPALFGFVFAVMSSFIILLREVQPETPLGDVLQNTESAGVLALFVILAILFAPLMEELIFRGYFFGVLKEQRGQTLAFLIISALFGFLHVGQYWGDWLAIAMVCLLGFALTWIRIYNQNTLSSIIMHYTYNTCVILIPVIALTSNMVNDKLSIILR